MLGSPLRAKSRSRSRHPNAHPISPSPLDRLRHQAPLLLLVRNPVFLDRDLDRGVSVGPRLGRGTAPSCGSV